LFFLTVAPVTVLSTSQEALAPNEIKHVVSGQNVRRQLLSQAGASEAANDISNVSSAIG